MSTARRIPVACECGRRMTVRAELAGTRGRCPNCGKLIEIPSLGGASASVGFDAGKAKSVQVVGATCSICQTIIEAGDDPLGCQGCELPYHRECWSEYGGCAAYGCENAPKHEKKEAPPEKQCPFCGELIPAKVTRCPSCRERFDDARPLDEGYIDGLVNEPKLKALRTKCIWYLVACLLPCIGPVTAVIGWQWLQSSRYDLEDAGGVYITMVKAGMSMGLVYTFLHVLLILGAAAS